MSILWPLLIPFFLCWGSFLNVVGYRLIKNISLFDWSHCPSCKTFIKWYDNIPVISWFMLKGTCRSCKKQISWLYPFIEIFTTVVMTLLYLTNHYFFGYFIFFSILIVTIRSDLESMLVSRFMTLAVVPLGLLFSVMDLIPIMPINSILGAGLGYGFLFAIARIFTFFTKREGMGQGDLDLIALIGSFIGVLGVWSSLLFGSISGTIAAISYFAYLGKMDRNLKIPFGPFLAFGAIVYVLFQETIIQAIHFV